MDSIEALSGLFNEEDITITQEEINQMNEEVYRKQAMLMKQLEDICNEVKKDAARTYRRRYIKDVCKEVTKKGLIVVAVGTGLRVLIEIAKHK